jgi:UDP-N-acetylglucosamine diphosphorylase/glucosamine-1-phosphate N-acetyltransferase
MKLVVFEDDQFDQFLPLSWVRAVFELKCGATTLLAKAERAAGRPADALIARDYLAGVLRGRHSGTSVNNLSVVANDETLFINARAAATGLKIPSTSVAGWRGSVLAFWRTRTDVTAIRHYDDLATAAARADKVEHQGPWHEYIWDLMLASPHEIAHDFEAAGRAGIDGDVHESLTVYGPREKLYIGQGATIQPFVCLDTRNGPITIEAGADVHPFTRIEGPCYIGPKSILLGAKIREGCSIGPMCRVGGEVEESIIHGYSNKYHDGFLGHTYVGEWVNLGALTSNSDLKNDYSTVSVIMPGNDTVDTGSTKVGSFIGDHVKTSIGTLLNTGTFVGTMAVLVATGAPLPKYIPPFAWFLSGAVGKGFGVNALIDTARTAMGRRKVELSGEEEAVLRHVYEITSEERMEHVRKGRRMLARAH